MEAPKKQPIVETIAPGGITDQPIKDQDKDSLGFGLYVDAVAAFLTDDSTKPPLTVSIEGEWGSGKSSFMLMLREKLVAKGKRTVMFNAWRHDKADSLWSAFALQLNEELSKDPLFTRRWTARWRLFLRRFKSSRLQGYLDVARVVAFLLLFLGAAGFVTAVAQHHGAETAKAMVEQVAGDSKGKKGADTKAETKPGEVKRPEEKTKASSDESVDATVAKIKLPATIAGGAAVLGLLVTFLTKFKDLFGNPFAIDLAQYARSPKYKDQISFIEQFHDDFAKVVEVYVQENEPVFVFIDDLDRCEVPKAADLVQGLNLLISDIPNFFFIIGMDREKVAAALAIKFEKALPYLAPKLSTGEKLEDKEDRNIKGGLAFGYSFIEKFVQVPFRVPRPVHEIAKFFQSLSQDDAAPQAAERTTPTEAEVAAIALQLRFDSPKVRAIGLAMAKAFDYNPRRLKQFLNLFRLQAFIANNTGLFRGEDALTLEQLGKFVAVGLRWPLLLAEVAENPPLLAELERQAVELARSTNTAASQVPDASLRKAADPFNRWSDSRDLQDFMCLALGDSQLVSVRDEWSFQKLDIESLLRVSPPVEVVPEEPRAAPPNIPASPEPSSPSPGSSPASPPQSIPPTESPATGTNVGTTPPPSGTPPRRVFKSKPAPAKKLAKKK